MSCKFFVRIKKVILKEKDLNTGVPIKKYLIWVNDEAPKQFRIPTAVNIVTRNVKCGDSGFCCCFKIFPITQLIRYQWSRRLRYW